MKQNTSVRCLLAASAFLLLGSTAAWAGNRSAPRDPVRQALDLYGAAGKGSTPLAGWLGLERLRSSATDAGARASIRQLFAMQSSELGLYDEAIAEFPFAANKPVAAGPLPDARYRATAAADAVARLVRGRRIVIINEAHHVPQTRLLLLELLPRLRSLGFTDYAAETLDADAGRAIARRGYAVRGDGVYSREPVFGQLLRTAAGLGYRIDSYEALKAKSTQERETLQAGNLAALLRTHPDARLIVHVGYAHVREAKTPERIPMAAELRRLTGIDPLTVDQTTFLADVPVSRENPAYRRLLSRLPPGQAEAMVFVTSAGAAWSYEPGQYDISVVLPDPPPRHGRPGWLWEAPLQRQPVQGYASLCHDTFPCAVSARRPEEGADAVPADAMVLRKASDAPALALPQGRYRLSATDGAGHPLGERLVEVADSHSRQ